MGSSLPSEESCWAVKGGFLAGRSSSPEPVTCFWPPPPPAASSASGSLTLVLQTRSGSTTLRPIRLFWIRASFRPPPFRRELPGARQGPGPWGPRRHSACVLVHCRHPLSGTWLREFGFTLLLSGDVVRLPGSRACDSASPAEGAQGTDVL